MFRTRQRAASGIAVCALIVSLALAGCAPSVAPGVASLDDDPGATTTPGADDASLEGDQVKFTECMREHGIDVPDPDPDQGGFGISIPDGSSPEEVNAALEACEEFMPGGGEPMQL